MAKKSANPDKKHLKNLMTAAREGKKSDIANIKSLADEARANRALRKELRESAKEKRDTIKKLRAKLAKGK